MQKLCRTGAFLLCALIFAGCQTTPNPNVNVNANRVINANVGNSNAGNANVAPATTVDTREPDAYQATVTLKLETMGEQQAAKNLPTISANVARSGDNRRMEFSLPNGEKVIYLDAGGKSLLISPSRKQFAELNKESTGIEVRRLLMPDQIVRRVQGMKGLERIGEENVGGRTAVKYRYGATTNTQTQAGQVNTESVVLVDKDTSLPLRSETISEAQGGQVQGIKGLRLVTEMSNIQTTAPPELFAQPTDYKQVDPKEVREQVESIFKLAGALLGQMMQNTQQQPAGSPAASPAMSPTASPK